MQILGATLCGDEITSIPASKVQDCDDSATVLEKMSLLFPVSLRKHVRGSSSIRHIRLSSSGDGCQRQLKKLGTLFPGDFDASQRSPKQCDILGQEGRGRGGFGMEKCRHSLHPLTVFVSSWYL